MARLNSRTLFFTTSPRTPTKMIPEIQLLGDILSGQVWNATNQRKFMEELSKQEFFSGDASKDPAFSARDRINRAPKALGFVDLDPVVAITAAGEEFISGIDSGEILLRQLLKFQLPSHFHKPTNDNFYVKPYLEILRLIRICDYLTFDELCLFGMQLTDFRKIDELITDVQDYRKAAKKYQGNYKKFRDNQRKEIIRKIYEEEIESGNIATRESNTTTVDTFLKTKYNNQRDYTDACIRYLRGTGMIAISTGIHSKISIMKDKLTEVDFLLKSVNRVPTSMKIADFKKYLFDIEQPVLYTDDKDNLVEYLMSIGPFTKRELSLKDIRELKLLKRKTIEINKDTVVNRSVKDLQSYLRYQDIMDTYDNMHDSYDSPLIFEWNTWRSMVMMNDGVITGNFTRDDAGDPMSTAGGKVSDIICDYGDFGLTVEVTLRTGHKQFEAEGESILRHLGQYKKESGKRAFCLFIAPKINETCIAYFFSMHKTKLKIYGGESSIIPLQLEDFRYMIDNAYNSNPRPTSDDILRFLERCQKAAVTCEDEMTWFQVVGETARKWMRN